MNLSAKLRDFLNIDFLTVIDIVAQNADNYGVNAYIIGGAVRDLILDKPIYDIDIVIEGNAIEFCQYLEEENLCKILRTAPDFGTAKICFNKIPHLELDFASTRKEQYPKAGHLPIVEKIGCSLSEDIKRRDFRANALALQINKSSFGKLIDHTGGLNDLEKKELKILHDKSFIDDPTRIIRGLRFMHKLNFKLEKNTKALQDNYLATFSSNDICYERIKQVTKLAFNLNSIELFEDFLNNKIYKLLCDKPRTVNLIDLKDAISKNAKTFSCDTVWLIYLASLITTQEAQKLNLTAKEMNIISSLEKILIADKNFNTNFEIYQFYRNEPIEAIIASCAIEKNNYPQNYLNELKNIKLNLNGKDLLNIGFKAGKTIGVVLEKILQEKIENNLQTIEEELAFAKEIYKQSII